MDRGQLTLTITGALIAAAIAGWCLRWIFGIINRPPPAPPPEETELMASLRQAQEAQAAAEKQLSELDQYYRNRLAQTEAELEAAMDALGAVRRELDAMGRES